MFKVSFNKDNYKKVKTFNNKVVTVTIEGKVEENMDIIPFIIRSWAEQEYTGVDVEFDYRKIVIVATGTAKCSSDDVFNVVIGERIAESKAKIKLYRFMKNFCDEMVHYYAVILSGTDYDRDTASKDSLLGAYSKYCALEQKELEHLNKLIKDSSK